MSLVAFSFRRSGTLCAALLGLLIATPALAENERMERIVHQEKSLYRNILIAEGEGVRCMSFGLRHGRQTCIDLQDPSRLVLQYTQALFASLFIAPKPRRVLVIGLGGGVVPTTLHALDAKVEIDAIEVDPAVAAVAIDYFNLKPDARSRVHIDDGRVFVRKQARAGVQYDLIVLDAFDHQWVPEHLTSVEFLQQIKTLLSADGVVAANTYATGPMEQHERATYQAAFGGLYQLDMDAGNRILLARNGTLPPLSALQRNAASLAAPLSRFGIDAPDLAARIAIAPKASGVRVLTDQYSPANLLLGGRH